MKFSRRNFMKLGGAAALGGIGLSKIALARGTADILEESSSEFFRGLFKSEFILSNDQVSISARLVKVTDLAPPTKSGKCFTLVFETLADGPVNGGTYYVFSPETGSFELFMTEGAIGKSKALVAVINRI